VNLRPTQIVGQVAIVVFGGILVWTLVKPEPVPGTMPITDAIATTTPEAPAAPPSAPSDPLAIGSDEAKDARRRTTNVMRLPARTLRK